MTGIDVVRELHEQLDWHWTEQARPRLEGLTDAEYLWEPVPGAWSIRTAADGATTIDWTYPPPEPAPVTTIAWRLGHVIVGVLGARAHAHFDGPPADYSSWPWALTAGDALDQLDSAYAAWSAGVRSLTLERLGDPVGEAEGPWADHPMVELVLHINRETIHHLAEVALLRDLWAHRG